MAVFIRFALLVLFLLVNILIFAMANKSIQASLLNFITNTKRPLVREITEETLTVTSDHRHEEDASSSNPKQQRRSFKPQWTSTRPWLKFDSVKNVMICELCKQFDSRKMSTFVDGCSSFKLDTITKHEISDVHKSAVVGHKARVLAKSYNTPILQGLRNMNEAELDLYQKQFRTAFYVAKMDRPFTDFPTLCKLQSQNFSCDLTKHYCNNKQCQTFISYIAGTYQQELVDVVKGSEFFSLICDGSTDSAIIEEEVYYVLILNENYEPCMRFVGFQGIDKADAPGLVAASIETMRTHLQLTNWQDRLVVVCCDGASVNLGVNKGFVVRLARDHNVPHLIGMHCTAHRLELAIKDAAKAVSYMDTVDEFLQTLFSTYHNSALMWSGLRETAKAFDMSALKPVCVWGTRWVGHRLRAVDVVMKQYQVLATHLHQVSIHDASDKAAKCKGLYRTMTTLKFVLFLQGFQYFLQTCSSLSEVLQKNTTDLEKMNVKVATTLTKLKNYEASKKLKSFIQSHTHDGQFKGIKLDEIRTRGDKSADASEKVAKDLENLFSKATSSLIERFETTSDNKFRDFRIFSPKQWPVDVKQLSGYGSTEIESLVSRYKDLLLRKGYNPELIPTEWESLLFECHLEHGREKLDAMSSVKFWPTVLRDRDKLTEYRNVLALVQIMLVIPVSSSEAERGFSWMTRIKSDVRSRLKTEIMGDLMRIHMAEEDLETFDPRPSVLLWWKSGKSKRRLVNKYGPRRKWKTNTHNSDSSSSSSESEDSDEQ